MQVKDMATEQRERLMSATEWKFIGFLALAFLLTPIFYGLPLLSPLFAMSTSVRTHRTKMVWLWVVCFAPGFDVDRTVHPQTRRTEQLRR
jgi:hypothetical protein